MWKYDEIFGKALAYFRRGQEHAHSDDDEFMIWYLLGLEFLLRSPLARHNPALLAALEGESILAAVGIPVASDSYPKSIPTHTVISRLGRVIPEFTRDIQDDATVLTNLRNVELHSGEAIAASTTNDFWLPKLVRVGDPIATHLGVELDDVLGDDVVRLGRTLVDEQDKKLQHEISQRLQQAREFFDRLTDTEQASRAAALPNTSGRDVVTCPGCGLEVPVDVSWVRNTAQRFENGEFVIDVVKVATGLRCPVCGLVLSSTAEVKAAGLPQQLTGVVRESLEERFMDSYEPDYGND